MLDFYSRLKSIDLVTLAFVGGIYGAIPALMVYVITESLWISVIVGLAAGIAIAIFIDASCEAERTRAADRARNSRRNNG